jgi:DNA-binding response OmpR family regulator
MWFFAATTQKKLLLVDLDDSRQTTRVATLGNAGYRVDVRADYFGAEDIGDEADYELVIVAMHAGPRDAAAYTDRLSRQSPGLPILLLTDTEVYAALGTLSASLEAGNPVALDEAGGGNAHRQRL